MYVKVVLTILQIFVNPPPIPLYTICIPKNHGQERSPLQRVKRRFHGQRPADLSVPMHKEKTNRRGRQEENKAQPIDIVVASTCASARKQRRIRPPRLASWCSRSPSSFFVFFAPCAFAPYFLPLLYRHRLIATARGWRSAAQEAIIRAQGSPFVPTQAHRKERVCGRAGSMIILIIPGGFVRARGLFYCEGVFSFRGEWRGLSDVYTVDVCDGWGNEDRRSVGGKFNCLLRGFIEGRRWWVMVTRDTGVYWFGEWFFLPME